MVLACETVDFLHVFDVLEVELSQGYKLLRIPQDVHVGHVQRCHDLGHHFLLSVV